MRKSALAKFAVPFSLVFTLLPAVIAVESLGTRKPLAQQYLKIVEAASRVSDFKVVSEEQWKRPKSYGFFINPMWSQRGILEAFGIAERLGIEPLDQNTDPTEEFGKERGIIYIRDDSSKGYTFVALVHESIHALLHLAIAIGEDEEYDIIPLQKRRGLQKKANKGSLELRLFTVVHRILYGLKQIARGILLSENGIETHFLQEFIAHPLGTLSRYAHEGDVLEEPFNKDLIVLSVYSQRDVALSKIRAWHSRNEFPSEKTDRYMREIMRIAPNIVEWISNDFQSKFKPNTSDENVEAFLSLTSSIFSFAELILSQKNFRLEGTGILYRNEILEEKIRSIKRLLAEKKQKEQKLSLQEILEALNRDENFDFLTIYTIRARVELLEGSRKYYNKNNGVIVDPVRFINDLYRKTSV